MSHRWVDDCERFLYCQLLQQDELHDSAKTSSHKAGGYWSLRCSRLFADVADQTELTKLKALTRRREEGRDRNPWVPQKKP